MQAAVMYYNKQAKPETVHMEQTCISLEKVLLSHSFGSWLQTVDPRLSRPIEQVAALRASRFLLVNDRFNVDLAWRCKEEHWHERGNGFQSRN